jgi:hypothetical protein
MATAKDKKPWEETLELSMTREELDAAYVMWKAGAKVPDLAKGFGTSGTELYWFLVMYDKLGKYTVHYKDSNQPTM